MEDNKYVKIEKNRMSPWTALILGLAGIIITAIIVAGTLANRGLDKIEKGEIEITVHDDAI